MAQFIPNRNTYADIGERFGAGFTEGHQTRSDEMALQKTIGSLPPDASPRQILDAITGTRTYSPEAKQNALKNYMGVANFDELREKRKLKSKLIRKRIA